MPQFKGRDWMKEALVLAAKAGAEDEVPVGAVVVLDGKIVGRGYNRREGRNDPISHAETEAIRSAAKKLKSWRLERCELYVTLEPCPMCLAACQQGRVARVIYGARDPKGGALSLGYRLHEDGRTNHRFEVEEDLREECGRVLSGFFKSKRRAKASSPRR